MAGLNLLVVKRRLVDVLPGVLGIEFGWCYTGKLAQAADRRPYGYLGNRAQGQIEPAAMAGGSGRFLRSSRESFDLAIETFTPGEETTEVAESDVVAVGRALEEYLAGNWVSEQQVPGLTKLLITDFELESGVNDDGAEATLAYTLQAESHVR